MAATSVARPRNGCPREPPAIGPPSGVYVGLLSAPHKGAAGLVRDLHDRAREDHKVGRRIESTGAWLA
jgi:hypothetical protein